MGNFISQLAHLNEKVKNCHTDLSELLKGLESFERKYKLSSLEFFQKFSRGELEHKTDFFEWHAYLDMSKKLIQRIRELEREIGNELEQDLLESA